MRKRELDRWYRVQMNSGPFTTGANEYDLVRDVRDCIRRGVDFVVTWHDTDDEANSTTNLRPDVEERATAGSFDRPPPCPKKRAVN